MTPEGEIQAHLKSRVEVMGGQFRKLQWTGRSGAPDCLIWWPGPVFAFVEVKAPGGRLSTLQERELARLASAGFMVAVIWSKEEADEIVFMLTQPLGCVQ